MTVQRRMFFSFRLPVRRSALLRSAPPPSTPPPCATTSSGVSSRLSVPRSIRSSTDLLHTWTRLSHHFEMLILTQPIVCRAVVEAFADLLDHLDRLT